MHNNTFALTLLALFTTPEKAAEIEGDLLEQSRREGALWFWWQVKLTCLALFFQGMRAEAGKLLLISYAIYELVLKINWWVLNPVRSGLRRGLELDVPAMAIANYAIEAQFAFIMGLLLTRLSPKHGGQLVLLTCGLVIARVIVKDGFPDAGHLIVYVFIAMAGALVMKWQELRHGGWNCGTV